MVKYTLIIFFVINYCNCFSVLPAVISYLQDNNVKLAYFFSCWENKENVELWKKLSELSIRISFINSDLQVNEVLHEKFLRTYGYILDLDCPQFENLLEKNAKQRNFRIVYPWLLLTNRNEPFTFWAQYFENIKLRLDSDVRLAVPHDNDTLKIIDVYNPGFGLGGKPIFTDIGNWTLGNGLVINKIKTNFYANRMNISDVLIRAGTVILMTNYSGTYEDYMQDTSLKQFDTRSKYYYPLFLFLRDIHGFKFNMTIEDKWFGNLPSGIDGGLCQLLHEDKIDITCTGGSQSRPARINVIDYLMPSYRFRPIYIFRNPDSYDPLSNEFLKPFSGSAWLVTGVFTFLICLALKLAFWVENAYFGVTTRYSWVTSILTTISIIFQQGASLIPAHTGGHTVFLTLLIMSFLVYNYYTSAVLSFLLNAPPSILNTLDQLGHSQLEIGIEDTPYTMTWFKKINDSDVQYIYKHKVSPPNAAGPNIYTPDEGIAKVAKGGFAYHTQADTGYFLISKTFDQEQICDLAQISMIPQNLAGLMIQKKSQFGKMFHITLRKAKAAGLVKRISLTWESDKPECLANARIVAVRMDQTFIAFLKLFVGMALAFVFLGIEIYWKRMDLDSKFQR